MGMMWRRTMMTIPHHCRQLFAIDYPAAQHAGTGHITISNYHVASNVCHVHAALYRTHWHRRM